MNTEARLTAKFRGIWPHLDERSRRLMAASEAKALGWGGMTLVSRASGLSRKAILKGIREIESRETLEGRIRRAGGGRKPITETDSKFVSTLKAILGAETRRDPESLLRSTLQSTRTDADTLTRLKHPGGHVKVGQTLGDLGHSLQGSRKTERNRKTEHGEEHPDREAQFRHIGAAVMQCLKQNSPVISVDTKKRKLIGNDSDGGQQGLAAKKPKKVRGHDIPHPDVPRAYPYGIYDIGSKTGLVNVGTDHDTGAFAVASIRGWWRHEGKRLYPQAKSLLMTTDGGSSNGRRLDLWKVELQKFSDESGLAIAVCHLPPGIRKWDKVEHPLFSFISSSWRGEPLRDYETQVSLIARSTTAKGLSKTCRLDRRKYPIGRKVTAEQMKQLHIYPGKLHSEWNYVIKPHPRQR